MEKEKTSLKILKWFCPPGLYEGLAGDLMEQFQHDQMRWGKGRAKRRMIWNVIRLFHPEIILRNRFNIQFIHTMLLSNYFKVSVRNIQKRKLYSFINTFGLSVGIAFCILIYLFILDEQSFDQFHVNKDKIYRIEVKSYNYWDENASEDERYETFPHLQLGLAPVLKEEAASVEFVTRYAEGQSCIVSFQEKIYNEELTYVDGDFFKMFSFVVLKGSLNKAFEDRTHVVITKKIADKYFGDDDPIGKTISIDQGGTRSYNVIAVLQDPPAQSSLDFDLLAPIENVSYYKWQAERWGNFNTPTIVQLHSQATLPSLAADLEAFKNKYLTDVLKKRRTEGNVPDGINLLEYQFTALPDWHLKKEINWHKVSDPQYAIILSAIALLILIIACINYISLSLTSSASRRSEVGIRKAMGAFRKQLIVQFATESVLLTFLSLIASIGLVFMLLPFFNEFTGKEISLSLFDYGKLFSYGIIVSIVVGLVAGLYPSLVLSAYRPVSILKNQLGTKLKIGFTKPLVVLQFAISGFLIVSSVIMFNQMEYITNKDLGYNTSQVVVVSTQSGWNKTSDQIVEQFRQRLSAEPDVELVSGTSISFNKGWSLTGYKIDGVNRLAYVYGVDYSYIPLLGIELVEGRNFDPSISTDSTTVIVNEALVKDMGWEDPLNEYLNYLEDSVGPGAKVIGVVKDYHFRSLETSIDPMFLSMRKDYAGHLNKIMIKIAANNIPETMERINSAWRELYPDKPFEYSFLDQDVAAQYESYLRWMKIMGLSTAFAILVSCLGLFGLSGINAINRTKEIGIRKVMGAQISDIFALLNKQFVYLSLIAFAIAIPFSVYTMAKWLDSFKYRIELDWSYFVVSLLLGMMIALLAVSFHAIKSALTNPAETLKYE